MAPVHFGILMVPYQVIDVAGPIDILSSCSKSVLEEMAATANVPVTSAMIEKAVDFRFHHISETRDPVQLSASFQALPTTTCDECPPLDYLLVGGPSPAYQLSDRFAEFLRAHVNAGKVLFTTCTGALAISPSGLLDGKNATTNHIAVDIAKHVRPNVKWTKEKQWVVDGNIWTAGGACAGMDMMAHWFIETYGMERAIMAFDALDFEPRDVNGKLVLLPAKHGIATA